MPGLVDSGLGLVRAHLAAPGVGSERRELGALDPLEGLEREARRVSARIAVPAPGLELGLHLSGAHHHEVATLQLHFLRSGGAVEVGRGDRVAVLEDLFAQGTRHVEEHAAADHSRLGLLDAAFLRPVGGDLAAVVAVPHGVLVEHMAQAVPLRAALQGHHDHVVRGADAAVVEHTRIGVGARAQHRVHRVDPAHRGVLALRALGAVVVEVEREGDDLPLFHQSRRGDDVLGPRVVQRADFIVGTPLAPVLVFLRGIAEILVGELARGHGNSLFLS